MDLHDVTIEGHVQRLVLGDPSQCRPEHRMLVAVRTRHAEVEGTRRGLLDGGVDHTLERPGQRVAASRPR